LGAIKSNLGVRHQGRAMNEVVNTKNERLECVMMKTLNL